MAPQKQKHTHAQKKLKQIMREHNKKLARRFANDGPSSEEHFQIRVRNFLNQILFKLIHFIDDFSRITYKYLDLKRLVDSNDLNRFHQLALKCDLNALQQGVFNFFFLISTDYFFP